MSWSFREIMSIKQAGKRADTHHTSAVVPVAGFYEKDVDHLNRGVVLELLEAWLAHVSVSAFICDATDAVMAFLHLSALTAAAARNLSAQRVGLQLSLKTFCVFPNLSLFA